MRAALALLLIGLTNSSARADATVAAPPRAAAPQPARTCASPAQLAALDRYCANDAALSEQRACRIVRRALTACRASAEPGDDDGVEAFRVDNPSPQRTIDQWLLELRRNGTGYALVSFRRILDDDCDCC